MKILALLTIIGVYFGALYYCGRGLDFSGGEDNIDDDVDKKNTFEDEDLFPGDLRNRINLRGSTYWDD